jgi:hypothetical protein
MPLTVSDLCPHLAEYTLTDYRSRDLATLTPTFTGTASTPTFTGLHIINAMSLPLSSDARVPALTLCRLCRVRLALSCGWLYAASWCPRLASPDR